RYGALSTVAIGDSLNDLPMLAAADRPILIQRTDGTYDPDITLPNLVCTQGVGPEGWNRAILSVLASA
ncbi:MAG: mannosyl-3-phosphoglycerate phosphatase, partial [Nitrospirae bacterium]|nr:mannosyl-3-phosphoglycerate phosphatase [Nitrospirota bacterium]